MTNNTGAVYLASVASSRDGALSFTKNTWCAQQRFAAPALCILVDIVSTYSSQELQ